MSGVWAAILTVLGALLVLLVLRDAWHTVFHPSGRGTLSIWAGRLLWPAFRTVGERLPQAMTRAGPTILLVTILLWLAGLALGWALVYWPYLPDEFLLAPGMIKEANEGFLDALYFSLVSLSTVGYGNIAPTNELLRLVAPLEALTGFAVLTATLSWITSTYSPLQRRRSLASDFGVLGEIAGRGELPASGVAIARVLGDLASRIGNADADLHMFPVTFYFHPRDESLSLPSVLPVAARLAARFRTSSDADVAFEAQRLAASVAQFEDFLASQFLSSAERPARSYAKVHRREGDA